MKRAVQSVGLALWIWIIAAQAGAQDLRPGDTRPPLPSPAPQDMEQPQPFVLPPLPEPEPGQLDAGLAVTVRRFDVVGSTVFGAEELRAALAPWLGRAIRSEELLAARDAVTALYRDAGYSTSGAVVPDQSVTEGFVTIEVVEGRLGDIDVRSARYFRPLYFSKRLRRAARAPIQVARLEQALQLLQRDPWIERVDARLEPGEQLGESRLVLVVRESTPWRARLAGDNGHSPAVGSAGGSAELRLANLFGLGDVWSGRAQLTDGLRDLEARFELPLTPWDTRLGVRFRDTRSEIVEAPFDALEIEASSQTVAFSLAQPVHRTAEDEIWLEISAERRQTRSQVLGTPFCFEVTAPDCERPTVALLRAAAQWTRRTRSNVLALRSQLSFGIDALGATRVSDTDLPDGRFVAWLSQAQWIRVLPPSLGSAHLLLRGDLQVTNQPLLSLEKFAMGGRLSVRGYRENQLVRDSGYTLSGELRVPVLRDSLRRPLLEVVPFLDYAQGWNAGGSADRDELMGIGAGLRFLPRDGVKAELYWGAELLSKRDPDRVLQDDGIHFRVQVDAPTIF